MKKLFLLISMYCLILAFAVNCSKNDAIDITHSTLADGDPPKDTAGEFDSTFLYNAGFRDLYDDGKGLTGKLYGDDVAIKYYQDSTELGNGTIKLVVYDSDDGHSYAVQIEGSTLKYARYEGALTSFPSLTSPDNSLNICETDFDSDSTSTYSLGQASLLLATLTLTDTSIVHLMPNPTHGSDVGRIRICSGSEASTCASLKLWASCSGCVNYNGGPKCIGNICWRRGQCCSS